MALPGAARGGGGKTIVFPKDIAERKTTMTYAGDVARVFAEIIGNKDAYGKAIHPVTTESVKWFRIIEIYERAFKAITGNKLKIKYLQDYHEAALFSGREFQMRYDRLFDRQFDHTMAKNFCGMEMGFTPVEDGLTKCLKAFISSGSKFRSINWAFQAWQDRKADEKTPLSAIHGKDKLKYVYIRYMPYDTTRNLMKSRLIKSRETMLLEKRRQ